MINETKFSTDDLISLLFTLRLSLRGTEYTGVTQVIDILQNPPDVAFAKKILYMIETNGASNEDIKHFCETFIRSKEEE